MSVQGSPKDRVETCQNISIFNIFIFCLLQSILSLDDSHPDKERCVLYNGLKNE